MLMRQDASMPAEVIAWIAADSARARQFAADHPSRVYPVLGAIAEQGSAALKSFSATLTDPTAQRQARQLLLVAAGREGDAASFTELYTRLGSDSNPLKEDAMLALARFHPEAAEAAIQSLADKPELCGQMFSVLAHVHPDEAAALLTSPAAAEFLKTGSGMQGLMRSLSSAWAVEDPSAAQSWLLSLPVDLRSKVLPLAPDIAAGVSNADWLAVTSDVPADYQYTSGLASQAVRRTSDPAVLAAWCASFPEKSRALLLLDLRKNLEDPHVADDIAQRVEQAIKSPSP
jgi:hypothetical protein